jgi:hypothetical protein
MFEPDTFRCLHGFLIIGVFYKFNKSSGENKPSSKKIEENIFQFSRISYSSAVPCVYRTEVGISKNYCTTNSNTPEVELWFCPWLILFTYWIGCSDLRSSLCPYYVYQPRLTWPQVKHTYTEWLKISPQLTIHKLDVTNTMSNLRNLL